MKMRKSLVLASLMWGAMTAQADVESWYTYWGLGFGNMKYTGDLDKGIDDLQNGGGFKKSSTMASDLLGFYWPVFEQNTIMGVVVNGVTESYRSSGLDVDVGVTTMQTSFSTMYFWGAEPGDNFFLRGDIGIGRVTVSVTNDQNWAYTGATDSGIGVRVGGGYGIPISGESRVLITVLVGKNSTDEGDASFGSLLVGGLW
ncbi:MAG: hypothetical protein IT288_09515 [Bdellovibrionales bacterium]|nr:hypothetical protein [Bdellovibrionales bacterium]